jgi:hypothetical protein
MRHPDLEICRILLLAIGLDKARPTGFDIRAQGMEFDGCCATTNSMHGSGETASMIYSFLHLLASVSVTDPTLREDRMAKVDVLGRSCGDGCRCCFDKGELSILGSRERVREGDAQHALDQVSVRRKGGSTSSSSSSRHRRPNL